MEGVIIMNMKEMNTKNAIFKIKHIINEYLNDGITKDNLFEAIDIIKNKLKCGEKHKQMWKELREYYGEYRINCEHMDDVGLEKVMDNFKQKYFPKGEIK